MKKKNLKNKFYHFVIFLIALAFIFLINVLDTRFQEKKINGVFISLKGEEKDLLLGLSDIKKMISNWEKNLSFAERKIREVSLFELKKRLENHFFIKKANVFFAPDRSLHLIIYQHKPIARLRQWGEEYLLSSEGKMINFLPGYAPELILVQGNFLEKEYENLRELIEFINEDFFLRQEIIGIKKVENRNFELTIQLKNHLVFLGGMDNFKEKFKKLEAFYDQYLNKSNLQKYKLIDLRYKGQLVATKR